HAKASVAAMVGTTIASMMASESIMIVVLPLPTGPWEGRMPGSQPVKASGASKAPQRSARVIGRGTPRRRRRLRDPMAKTWRAPLVSRAPAIVASPRSRDRKTGSRSITRLLLGCSVPLWRALLRTHDLGWDIQCNRGDHAMALHVCLPLQDVALQTL